MTNFFKLNKKENIDIKRLVYCCENKIRELLPEIPNDDILNYFLFCDSLIGVPVKYKSVIRKTECISTLDLLIGNEIRKLYFYRHVAETVKLTSEYWWQCEVNYFKNHEGFALQFKNKLFGKHTGRIIFPANDKKNKKYFSLEVLDKNDISYMNFEMNNHLMSLSDSKNDEFYKNYLDYHFTRGFLEKNSLSFYDQLIMLFIFVKSKGAVFDSFHYQLYLNLFLDFEFLEKKQGLSLFCNRLSTSALKYNFCKSFKSIKERERFFLLFSMYSYFFARIMTRLSGLLSNPEEYLNSIFFKDFKEYQHFVIDNIYFRLKHEFRYKDAMKWNEFCIEKRFDKYLNKESKEKEIFILEYENRHLTCMQYLGNLTSVLFEVEDRLNKLNLNEQNTLRHINLLSKKGNLLFMQESFLESRNTFLELLNQFRKLSLRMNMDFQSDDLHALLKINVLNEILNIKEHLNFKESKFYLKFGLNGDSFEKLISLYDLLKLRHNSKNLNKELVKLIEKYKFDFNEYDLPIWKFIISTYSDINLTSIITISERIFSLLERLIIFNDSEIIKFRIKSKYTEIINLIIDWLIERSENQYALVIFQYFNGFLLRIYFSSVDNNELIKKKEKLINLEVKLNNRKKQVFEQMSLENFYDKKIDDYLHSLRDIDNLMESFRNISKDSIERIMSLSKKQIGFVFLQIGVDSSNLFYISNGKINVNKINTKELKLLFAEIKAKLEKIDLFNEDVKQTMENFSNLVFGYIYKSFNAEIFDYLYIYPDFFLNTIPLTLLLKNGKYIFEEVNVCFVENVLILDNTPNSNNELEQSVLILKNPEYKKKDFSLQGADLETTLINLRLKNFSIKTLELSESTKEKFFKEIPKYTILHTISHSYFNEEHPLQSGLIFNRDPLKLLQAGELIMYNLENVELFYLSSCESAKVKVNEINELQGFQRVIFASKAKRMIGTQANITDIYAILFADLFYTEFNRTSNIIHAYNFALRIMLDKKVPIYEISKFKLVTRII
jgi:hypothetical protein